jgi:hypothetical protein
MNDTPESQNDMLEAWKKRQPTFGPQPRPEVPVFRTDAERLEECRRVLNEIFKISFSIRWSSCGPENPRKLAQIKSLSSTALARTQPTLKCDTIP